MHERVGTVARIVSMVMMFLVVGTTHAGDAPACATVRMSSPGWTDLEATSGIATVLLEGLGYRPRLETLSVAITYQALANAQLDVFLGAWAPAHDSFTVPLLAAGKIERLNKNLEGARYTLVVPDYVAAAGVRSFADLAAHGDQFRRRIYGIDAGSPGNESIQKAIDQLPLEGWTVVPSSEQGMLAEVARAIPRQRWVVFLGWEPHAMNAKYNLVYLSGGDRYFGANFGATNIDTVVRAGYASACPNVARLFRQLTFTIGMENELTHAMDGGRPGMDEAAGYLKLHPRSMEGWLHGVTTVTGKPGLPAVRASLGIRE